MPQRILFPNDFGFARPTPADVREAQQQLGFDDAMRNFLISQNGLCLNAEFPTTAHASAQRRHAWPVAERDSEGCADLRHLYALGAPEGLVDLRQQAAQLALFAGVFLPIGEDHGGNPLVQVLAGRRKGWIGSLDHELFASSEDFAAFAEEFELNVNLISDSATMADALCEEDLGLIWFHAPSLDVFLSECLHVDDEGNAFIVDAVAPV